MFQHTRKYFLAACSFLSLGMILLTGCQKQTTPVNTDTFSFTDVVEGNVVEDTVPATGDIPVIDSNDIPNLIDSKTEETEPAFQEYDISLMAVGDNLMHMGVVYTGKKDDGSYDYTCLYDGIGEFLDKADIKIINQETILAGNALGFSGYPHFNSPTEVGDSLAKVGFNVVLHASNHAADQGVSGIDNCVAFWKTHPEVLMLGIHEPYDKYVTNDSNSITDTDVTNRIATMEIGGYTFAILNYTYGPNYEIVSKEVASRMDILCNINEQTRALDFTTMNPQVLTDIEEADKLADIVIVCPHWGTEYETVPSSYQQEFARQMTQAGADVIIGTHPHVVQPVEWITAENGNTSLCYYSLGNYVSTQKNGQSMLEALAWVTFHVTEDGISISNEKTGVIPLVCHYSSNPVRIQYVYLLEEYTEELASHHGIISYGGISFHASDLQAWSDEILGSAVLDANSVID